MAEVATSNAMRNTLITIDGHIGSGALDLGKRISRIFDLHYFDRIALPGLKSNNGFTDSPALEEAYEYSASDRVWEWIEKAASYFAIGAAGDDPLLQGAADLHLPLTWDRDGPKMSSSSQAEMSLDKVADAGDAVIVHRAGSVALSPHEGLTKVGVFASWDERVERVMRREGLMRTSDAERIISHREEAQKEYFLRMHRADPEDPELYDIIVNTSETDISIATVNVSRFVKQSRDTVAA